MTPLPNAPNHPVYLNPYPFPGKEAVLKDKMMIKFKFSFVNDLPPLLAIGQSEGPESRCRSPPPPLALREEQEGGYCSPSPSPFLGGHYEFHTLLIFYKHARLKIAHILSTS